MCVWKEGGVCSCMHRGMGKRGGGGGLTIMVCTLQGNYAEWGRGQ